MVGVLEGIKQFFKGLFSTPTASIPQDISGHVQLDRVISKIDMGKSFNGHGMILSTCKFGEATLIRYHNKYYTGAVSCTYNCSEDNTKVELSSYSNTPKYIINILRNLNGNWPTINYIYNDIKVEINQHSICIDQHMELQGLRFKNHFDNINDLKNMVQILKPIRKALKTNRFKIEKKDKELYNIII